MANPGTADVGVDPLNAHIANLNMSVPSGDGTADPSSFWQSQAVAFPYPSPTDFSTVHQSQPLTDPTLDPQLGGYVQYADHAAAGQQVYWPSPSAHDPQTAAQLAQAGPSSAATAVEKPFKCDHQGCDQAYRLQCELDKHKNIHNRPRICQICGKGKAERKDLNRHMWARHPDEARRLKIPKEEDICPVCGHHGRKDNVKRHRDMKGH
ncbi:hypothetical protein C8A05DRAFT_35531 [Staphylotrichum tortipilum]|uniref:C2H2-type domain-containing protein n=1 Tax=Staphylotrichum tortipilum TaxID=2831512 RepID=A0AAN6MII9_9PEZI|nr:hypothetical protein C8A05DRAFT_35531 [Staphylotrichum longicolle]